MRNRVIFPSSIITFLFLFGAGHTVAQNSIPVTRFNTLDGVGEPLALLQEGVNPDASAKPKPAPFAASLLVTDKPYNAKCDGKTDDQAAIQAAFNDAEAHHESVEFPPGTCLTGTITWKGQSFFGAGMEMTTVRGKPGQDVFAAPDTATGNHYAAYIHDLGIAVDSTVNAASSHAPMPGNNKFPNRISGTYPSPSSYLAPVVNPLPASSGGPPAPGPVVFGPSPLAGGLTATAPTCTVTIPGMWFNSWNQTQQVAGAPITINGAGVGGANLSTTVASAISTTQIKLNSPCVATSVSNASGRFGAPLTAPWYVGVAGIAVPGSCQQTTVAAGSLCTTSGALNLNGLIMKNVWFRDAGYPNTSRENYTAGLFLQSPCYDCHFEKIDFQGLWYGYVEAQSPLNFVDNQTPDTATYKDLNFKSDAVAMITYNGSHRIIDGINIYGGNNAMATGLWELNTPNGYPSMEISHFYYECWSYNSGEYVRLSGSGNNIQGGSLGQCSGVGGLYVKINGNADRINANLPGLVMNGNDNIISNVGLPTTLVDNGIDNKVDVSSNQTYSNRAVYLNRPRDPLNKLDAGFLLSGNGATPYTSGADLLVTCSEFNFAFQNGRKTAPGCSADPTGAEITRSYFHATSADYSGWTLGAGGAQGNGPYGKRLIVGDRVPQAQVMVVAQARCNAECKQDFTLTDSTTRATLATGSLVFGTSWTVQTFAANLAKATIGDTISLTMGNPFTNGVDTMDVAFYGFEPIHHDRSDTESSDGTAIERNARPDDSMNRRMDVPPASLAGATGSIGGSELAAGTCATGAATVTKSTTAMAVAVSPLTYPGDGFYWSGYLSAPGTVTVKVCAVVAGRPKPSTYNVRVIP
jgi:hypothetical protein